MFRTMKLALVGALALAGIAAAAPSASAMPVSGLAPVVYADAASAGDQRRTRDFRIYYDDFGFNLSKVIDAGAGRPQARPGKKSTFILERRTPMVCSI